MNGTDLLERLERLSTLEPGWYANVGKRTGEECCAAMREAAALIRTLQADKRRMEEAMPDLSSVIGWLANGCNVAHAVTELRVYQARIDRARAALQPPISNEAGNV